MKKSFTILAAVLVTLCVAPAALAETPAPASNDGVEIAAPNTPKLYYSSISEMEPTVVIFPKNQTVVEGNYVVLECAFAPTSDPYLTLEVFFNGRPIDYSSVTESGKKKYEYVYDRGMCLFAIKQTVPDDSGTYTFRAVNRYNEVSASCIVLVLEK